MRKAINPIFVLLFLLAIPIEGALAVNHYRRHMAASLLATIRLFKPGVTTEEEAHRELRPFLGYEDSSERKRVELVTVRQVSYQFYNLPDWAASAASHLKHLPFRITPPWTLFEVDLDFVDGFLERIHAEEMQEDQPEFPHPNSASVSLFSTRFGAEPGPIPIREDGYVDFNGYSDHTQNSGQVDHSGNLTSFSCCHARSIVMDERATQAQVSKSLNFQLHCMTSFLRCNDDRQLLP